MKFTSRLVSWTGSGDIAVTWLIRRAMVGGSRKKANQMNVRLSKYGGGGSRKSKKWVEDKMESCGEYAVRVLGPVAGTSRCACVGLAAAVAQHTLRRCCWP